MSGDVTKRKTKLMRTIVRGSRKKRHGRNATQFESFAKHYFANVPPRDLVDKGPSTVLCGIQDSNNFYSWVDQPRVNQRETLTSSLVLGL